LLDAVAGILLVANATSLGWSLRGEWGHWWGATVPGALCGMALWVSFGGSGNVWQMLGFGSGLALAFSIGGVQSYGLLLGYATAEPGRRQRSTRFGLLGLLLVGGLWGFFGGLSLGLLLIAGELSLDDLAVWAIIASLGAFWTYKLLVTGLDLHLSPPRSDAWAALLGGALASAVFFGLRGDAIVMGCSLAGFLGFGGGFALSALIHREGDRVGLGFSSWKFIEHGVGFFGGLGLGVAGALARPFPGLLVESSVAMLSIALVHWLVAYMVLANNVEFWVFELGWFSRRSVSGFHVGALVTLAVLVWAASGLRPGGAGGQKWNLLLLLALYTAIGTAKFVRDRSSLRSKVVYAFLVQFVICVALLIVV
jgi:hypothetical protein